MTPATPATPSRLDALLSPNTIALIGASPICTSSAAAP